MQKLYIFVAIVGFAIAQEYYSNPLIPGVDTPDPGAIYVNGTYYVATTTDFNNDPNKFPIHASTDLVNWTLVGYIFPQGSYPSWAVQDFWAPEIHYIGPHYIVYFAARDTTGMLCVGAAYGKSVTGPFEDIGAPLIRNASVGNIDPTYFNDVATGKQYIIWKEDGNGASPPEKYTPIWASEVSEDALQIIGPKILLLENDPNSWEGILVEGPWVVKRDDTYYLFYSANMYATTYYALGVASADNILGPYTKNPANPIVHNNQAWSGPGHCSVLSVENEGEDYFFLYHSWVGDQIGGNYPRVLMMDAIQWSAQGWPSIPNSSPSSGDQVVPGYQL